MRVRLLESLAGPGKGPGAVPGDVWDCSKDEAERLIARGMAEPIKNNSVRAPENAMLPASQPREVGSTKRQPSDGPAS